MKTYKFRNCFLNTVERRVIRDGKYLELTPRTFDVLQMLVERSGEIVTKDEMLGKVWNGSFVEESNLPVHIAKLRRLLGEMGAERLIETVQGTGYRFIAPIESVNSEVWRKQLSGSGRRRTDRSPSDAAFDSVAVLPLRNESDNPEIDYLADGLTESFINSLSRMPGLKVLARDTVFRYKNKDTDAKDVGETLGVSAILTGRIRVIGDRLAISVELVKVADGSHLWGTQVDQPFADIIKIQNEISSTVSQRLKSEIQRSDNDSLNKSQTRDAESYRLYLKGKYSQGKRTEDGFYRAIEYFRKSVSYDPENILSLVETVECYRVLNVFDHISYDYLLSKINPILKILSELDQSIDVLQVMYGELKLQLDWEFAAAENHFRQALAINPNSVLAHYRYAGSLTLLKNFSGAMSHLNQVIEIDPLSPVTYKMLARLFYLMGRFEQAAIYLNDVLEIEPADYEALVVLGGVLTELQRYDEALDAFRKSINIHYNADTFAMIGYIDALEGRQNEAFQIIEQLKSEDDNNKHAIKIARIYVALGDHEGAFRYLDEAFIRHELDLTALSVDPRWSRIRHDPRFLELGSKVGLPGMVKSTPSASNKNLADYPAV